MIFDVADVKLRVLSSHVFSFSPLATLLTAGFTHTQEVSCPLCLNVHNCNLIFFMDSQGGDEKVYSKNSYRDNDKTV